MASIQGLESRPEVDVYEVFDDDGVVVVIFREAERRPT